LDVGQPGNNLPIKAVLFDLGNTLVGYYESAEFSSVLRRCLRECSEALGWSRDARREEALLEHALQLNIERRDLAVRPLGDRLRELFDPQGALDDVTLSTLGAAFLKPIFDLARPCPQALIVLESLRRRGIMTAIVSNTPWGSPASAWRTELARHGLLECVDAVVFCVDVGFRKPHRAPFDRALAMLDVAPTDALFVGDDPRWDVAGAQNAGLRAVLVDPRRMPGLEVIQNLEDIIRVVEEAH
jgi:HAD superfamily hydrolase (TIGR01509 family)